MKPQADVCRHIARAALKGRWWKTAMTSLVASIMGVFTNLVTGVLKLIVLSAILIFFFERVPFYHGLTILITFILGLIWLFIGSIVRLGYIDYNLAILDGRNESSDMLFNSGNWYNSIELRLILMILTGIGTLFFILPGIYIYTTYAMAPFLLEEKKDITVGEALKLSREKMKGNRFQFISLKLSFLGWKILGVITLGLGYFFITPYYAMAEAVFFNEASGRAEALYER